MAGYTSAAFGAACHVAAVLAAMHGGVQFICPSMHGGGAKRPSSKIFLNPDQI